MTTVTVISFRKWLDNNPDIYANCTYTQSCICHGSGKNGDNKCPLCHGRGCLTFIAPEDEARLMGLYYDQCKRDKENFAKALEAQR